MRIREVLLETVGNQTLRENRNVAKAKAWQNQGESGDRVADFLMQFIDGNTELRQ